MGRPQERKRGGGSDRYETMSTCRIIENHECPAAHELLGKYQGRTETGAPELVKLAQRSHSSFRKSISCQDREAVKNRFSAVACSEW